MTFKIKKRFIAGAACPKCAALDKVVMYKEDDKDYRECVACGFKDEMRFNSSPRELVTRVNTSEAIKSSETQVLTLDPNGLKGKS